MSNTFKKKVKILKKILKNYKKYLKNCSEIKCYIEFDNIIIEKINKGDDNRTNSIKIPVSDIDKTIIRYRALVHQNKEKSNGHIS